METVDNELSETNQHLISIENTQNSWFSRNMSHGNGEDTEFIRTGGLEIARLPELSKTEIQEAISAARIQADGIFSDSEGTRDDPDNIYKMNALFRARLRGPTITQLHSQQYATQLQYKQQPDIAHILHIMEHKERVEIQAKLGSRGFSMKKLLTYGGVYGAIEIGFRGMDLLYGTLSPEIRMLFDFVNTIRSTIRLTCVPILVQEILPGKNTPDKGAWRILREVTASTVRLSALRTPIWIVGVIGNPFAGSVVGAILFTGFIGALSTTIQHSIVNKVILYDEAEFSKKISESVLEQEKLAANLQLDLKREEIGFKLSDLPDIDKVLEHRDSLFAKYKSDSIRLLIGASCGSVISNISLENSGVISFLSDDVFSSIADSILFRYLAIPAAINLSSKAFGDLYRGHLKKYATATYNALLPESIRNILEKYLVESYTSTMATFMYYLYASIGGMWLGSMVLNSENARLLVKSLQTESYQVAPIEDFKDVVGDPELMRAIFGRTVNENALNNYRTPAHIDSALLLKDFEAWEELHLNKERLTSVDLDGLSPHFHKIDPILKENIRIVASDRHILDDLVKTKFPDALIGNRIQEISKTDYESINDQELSDFTRFFGRLISGVSWEDFKIMREARKNMDNTSANELWNMWNSADASNTDAWNNINRNISEEVANVIYQQTSATTTTLPLPPPITTPAITPIQSTVARHDFDEIYARPAVIPSMATVQLMPEVREGLSTSVAKMTRKTTLLMEALLPEITHSLQRKSVVAKSLTLYLDLFWGGISSQIESLFLSFRSFLAVVETPNSIIGVLREALEKNISESCLIAYGNGGVQLGIDEHGAKVPVTATGEPFHPDCYMYPPFYIIAKHILTLGVKFFTYGPGLAFYLKYKMLILPFELIFNSGVIRDTAATARLIRISAQDLLQGGYYAQGSLAEAFTKLAIAYSCVGEATTQGSICSEYVMYFNPVQSMKGVDIFKITEPFVALEGSEDMNIIEYISNVVRGVTRLLGPDVISEMVAGTSDMSTVSDVGRIISENMQSANFAVDLIGFLKDMVLRFMINATLRN